MPEMSIIIYTTKKTLNIETIKQKKRELQLGEKDVGNLIRSQQQERIKTQFSLHTWYMS